MLLPQVLTLLRTRVVIFRTQNYIVAPRVSDIKNKHKKRAIKMTWGS
jgi:hypothetical protein